MYKVSFFGCVNKLLRLKYSLLLLFLLVAHNAFASNSKFVSPDDKVLVFVGQDVGTIKRYVEAVDIEPAGVMAYTSIQKMDGVYEAVDYGSGAQHIQGLIEQYPNSAVQIGLYMVGALDGVISGVYEHNIEKMAKFFKEHQRPFYLRIGYEFDSEENNYDPEKYKSVYRYIVDHLKEAGVNNVAYVWHAHGVVYERSPMEWYPGDEYVDWVALSYFSPYNTEGMKRVADIARELNKPLMIAESTPVKLKTVNGEDTWKRWFRFVFKHIEDYDVRAFCYINSHWDAMPMWQKIQWGDARIEENAYIMDQWKRKMGDPKFVHGSKSLFGSLGYSD